MSGFRIPSVSYVKFLQINTVMFQTLDTRIPETKSRLFVNFLRRKTYVLRSNYWTKNAPKLLIQFSGHGFNNNHLKTIYNFNFKTSWIITVTDFLPGKYKNFMASEMYANRYSGTPLPGIRCLMSSDRSLIA